MASTITNLAVTTLSQAQINATNGFGDSIKPFTTAFDDAVLYGNAVSIPVVTPGASGTALNWATDDSNSVVFTSVTVNKVAKEQLNVPSYQYVQLEKYLRNGVIGGLAKKVNATVVSAAYALFTTTNFATKSVSSAWSDSAPTIAALNTAVEYTKATGKVDPNNVFVLMPAATYAVIKTALDALPRDVMTGLGYEIIPVRYASIAKTFIVDKSAVAIGIGLDAGEPLGEFEFISAPEGQTGYGLHIIPDAINSQSIVGLRTLYGVGVMNASGAAYISAS